MDALIGGSTLVVAACLVAGGILLWRRRTATGKDGQSRTPWTRAEKIAALGLLVTTSLGITGILRAGNSNGDGQTARDTAVVGQVPREQLEVIDSRSLVGPGYGPERTVYRAADPPPEPTLNSIVDSPGYGDERNATLVKDAENKRPGGFADTVRVQPGHEYLIRTLVANDSRDRAASSLGTRIGASLPTTPSKRQEISASVSSDNARPATVHDAVLLTSDRQFNVGYVGGSASYFTGSDLSRAVPLPDSLVTSAGALLGAEKLDGVLPGGDSGVVVFRIKVYVELKPRFSVDADVRPYPRAGHLRGHWKPTIKASPGDRVDILLTFRNTGEARLDDVVTKVRMPVGLSYSRRSTFLANANVPRGTRISADSVVGEGLNVGSYAARGANAYLRLSARVAKKLPFCGGNSLGVVASVETGYGTRVATAIVEATAKVCPP